MNLRYISLARSKQDEGLGHQISFVDCSECRLAQRPAQIYLVRLPFHVRLRVQVHRVHGRSGIRILRHDFSKYSFRTVHDMRPTLSREA